MFIIDETSKLKKEKNITKLLQKNSLAFKIELI